LIPKRNRISQIINASGNILILNKDYFFCQKETGICVSKSPFSFYVFSPPDEFEALTP